MLAERSTRSRFAPRRRNSTTRRSASMAVIDAHAHIYPDKIASRAVDAVGDFYLIDMFGEGTVEHLLSAQQHAPITHFIVHSVATTPGSVDL